jgi:hypothetical protein
MLIPLMTSASPIPPKAEWRVPYPTISASGRTACGHLAHGLDEVLERGAERARIRQPARHRRER